MDRERPETGRNVDDDGVPPGVAAADYIEDMLVQLIRVADRNGLDVLAFSLRMAWSYSRGSRDTGPHGSRLG